MDDFPKPEPERLLLFDKKYVDVKKRLNHGETEDMYARIYQFGVTNRREVRTAKIVAYLLGWSLTRDGKPVSYGFDAATGKEMTEQERIDTVRSLDPDRALEIYTAIETHEAAMAAAREEEKKILISGPAANATSASRSVAVSPSGTSAPST